MKDSGSQPDTQSTERIPGQRLRELTFLNNAGRAINSTLDLEQILETLLDRVRNLLGIDACSIALKDEETDEIAFEAASGKGAKVVLGVRLKLGQGIAGWVAETGQPLVVDNVHQDPRFFPDVEKQIGMVTQAILCVPIILKEETVGVIEALNPGDVPFNQDAVELLSALAGLAATAINNARLFARAHNAKARYESLFEDSADPILITDLEGIVVKANRNACALFELSKQTLLDYNLGRFVSADGDTPFAKHLASAWQQDVTFRTLIPRQDSPPTVEFRAKQICAKEQRLIQWIGRDVSLQLELEQIRNDMTRMIVHDLRNPLANIMNSLDMLQALLDEPDESISPHQVLAIARRSGQRLYQLINSILDISMLESGQTILRRQTTNIRNLVNNAIEFVSPQAVIRNTSLESNIAPNLPWLNIDADMLSRVLINLLDNALKFTPVQGRVCVSAIAVPEGIKVTVTDTGPGIPAEQQKRIFEKFVRLQADGPKGTGLGLTFCRLAVEAHGGRIWVESEPEQGASFYFVLPQV